MPHLSHQRHIMGMWIFDLDNAAEAHALYAALPATLKPGAELRVALDGAHLLLPTDDAADWLRAHTEAD
ncbi:MAG: hypothetical protein Q8L66_10260 [Caulobacter sp.]|nr:hypothetical protein [Caulobacter sp.]